MTMDEAAVSADGHATAAHAALANSTYGAAALITNQPLVTAFISFAVAQAFKVLTSWFKEKRWDVRRLYGSGGMPSSHSATVSGLAVAIGLRDGAGGASFAIALVLASVVMYDASGVRLQAGRHAEVNVGPVPIVSQDRSLGQVLNQIVYELPTEHPLADSRPLREYLGHTPVQVLAGAMLGCFIAIVLFLISLIVHPP